MVSSFGLLAKSYIVIASVKGTKDGVKR